MSPEPRPATSIHICEVRVGDRAQTEVLFELLPIGVRFFLEVEGR